jgi:hypothetical protein
MPNHRRRLIALLLALTFVAAACGDDDADDAGAETTTTSAAETPDTTGTDAAAEDGDAAPDTTVELTATYQGVTESEVRIGIAAIDGEQLFETFGIDIGVFPLVDYYTALADAQNERGGVAGRMVTTTVSSFLPVGTTDSERVCTELLDDAEVFVVTGQFLDDNALCVTELRGHPYVGHFGENEARQERSGGLLFATEMDQTSQRIGGVTAMIEAGDLDGRTVALYWENPVDALYADAVRPLLEEAGVEVVAEIETGRASGDSVADDAAIDVAIERMRSEGVDLVLNLSGIGRILTGVQRNAWDVDIAITNGQAADRLDLRQDLGLTDETLARTIVVTVNKPTRDESLADPSVQSCLDDYDAAFPDAPLDLESEEIVTGLTSHCRAFALTVLILDAAGPDLTPESFIAAAEGLGTVDLPAMSGASLGPDKHSAGSAVRRYEYDASLGFWTPVGEPIVVDRG